MNTAGNRSGAPLPRGAGAGFLVLVLWLVVWAAPAANRIEQISPCVAPQIVKSKLIYTLDIVFKRRPENYWLFYDKNSATLNLDCFDMRAEYAPTRIPGKSPFGSLKVKNMDSPKTVSGKLCRIAIGLDSIWHCESAVVEPATIRVTIWKQMKPVVKIEKKSFPFLKYTAVMVAGAALTSGVVLLLTSGR